MNKLPTLRKHVGTLIELDTFAGPRFRQLEWVEGRADNVLSSLGFKFNPFAQSLVAVNLLFPVTKQGLTDKVAFVAGFEISF